MAYRSDVVSTVRITVIDIHMFVDVRIASLAVWRQVSRVVRLGVSATQNQELPRWRSDEFPIGGGQRTVSFFQAAWHAGRGGTRHS
jgi:hypothetical protein